MKLADAQAIAVFMKRPYSTIRRWIMQGRLTSRGTDPDGRNLYSIDEAEQLAATMKLDNPPDLREHGGASRGSVP